MAEVPVMMERTSCCLMPENQHDTWIVKIWGEQIRVLGNRRETGVSDRGV